MRELLHAARTPVQDYSGPELVAERKSVLVGTGERKTSGERSDSPRGILLVESTDAFPAEMARLSAVLPSFPDITGGSL